MSQEENDSSEDDFDTNSTNGYVEKKVLVEYLTEFKSLEMNTRKKIQRLREENLELSSLIDHLGEQKERSKEVEDKLTKELDLSKRNEEELRRELEEAKKSLTRMALKVYKQG